MPAFSRTICAFAALILLDSPRPCGALPQDATADDAAGPTYYWRDLSLSGTAILSTLFCCAVSPSGQPPAADRSSLPSRSIPLIAILRDTLGDSNPENDRLTYVWLLTYERPNLAQRLLSALPFFYWHVGAGPDGEHQNDTSPLLNLQSPEHAMVSDLGRDLMQWTLLDPSTMAIRSTSRAYRTNQLDHERLHIEEAISYLRQAPVASGSSGLTATELNTVVARLQLRKKLLGGLVSQKHAARLGEQASFGQQRIRMRNWELLRQCAEKTGLLFEPLAIGTTSGEYAMVSFPAIEAEEPSGTSTASVWKLLGIANPWDDAALRSRHGTQPVRLGVYSLNYAKAPLLLIDFRRKHRVRWHEITQRSINEITAGVIGISHFTNWYYYVGADLYDFYIGKHGVATDQAARLDCYAQFRVELATDVRLDPGLRKQMQERVESLEINPLESNPSREIAAASARYRELVEEAGSNGPLLARVEKDRRAELAAFSEGTKTIAFERFLHELSFGLYAHRAEPGPDELETLDRYRRIQYQLAFLDSLVKAGTRPEIAYDSSRIQESLTELSALISLVNSRPVLAHTAETLQKLKELSLDPEVEADCSRAVAALEQGTNEVGGGGSPSALGLTFRLSGSEEMRPQ